MRFSRIKLRLEPLQWMNAIVISALMRPTFPSFLWLSRVRNMPFRTRNSDRNLFAVGLRRMRALPPSSSSSRPSCRPSMAVISEGHSIISRRHRRTHQLNSLPLSLRPGTHFLLRPMTDRASEARDGDGRDGGVGASEKRVSGHRSEIVNCRSAEP